MKTYALLTAASLALLATPALAQTATPSTTTTPKSNMTTTAPAEKVTTTGNASAEAKFTSVAKGEAFTSKLKGLNVYNQDNNSVGEISDIAIKGHQIDALILSVGGFLGMGEHYVAVAPDSVKIAYDSQNDKWKATMNTTKEALKKAPEFKYPK